MGETGGDFPRLPAALTEEELGRQLGHLERALQAALACGDEAGLEVIGYGEITTVLRWRTPAGDIACKRLSPFPGRAAAEHAAAVIGRYVEELGRHGIETIDTRTVIVPSGGGSALYCVQPVLPAGVLGPEHFRRSSPEHAAADFRRILERLREAVSPTLAPDGQLSNWAFPEERLLYLDVSTPFLRDGEGREQFDFAHQARALPAPLRPAVRRWIAPRILDKYHDLRGQVVDFLGNLIKERLGSLLPALTRAANESLRLVPPLTVEEVERYYREDARTYAWLQAARRADRWVHRYLLWRTYGHLLPPPVERHLRPAARGGGPGGR